MEDIYKNYGKILNFDFINLPFRKHHLTSENSIVSSNLNRLKQLGQAAYHQQIRLFYFVDQNEALLKCVDDELNLERKEDFDPNDNLLVVSTVYGKNPGRLLEKPVSICINSNDDIFVGDNGNFYSNINTSRIFVFDSNLAIIDVIKHDEIVSPSFMHIEEVNKNQFKLYVADLQSNSLTVLKVTYNSSIRQYSSEFDKQIKISAPRAIRLTNDYIAVVSNRNLADENNKSGLDSIVVYNKQTLEHIRTIELVDLFGLTGLFVDKQLRFYTTAYKLSSKNCKNNGSDERELPKDMYLVVVDFNGKILQETNLGVESISDFLVFEDLNKIFILNQHKQSTLNLIEFTKN